MGFLSYVSNVCRFFSKKPKEHKHRSLEEYIGYNYISLENVRAHIVPASDSVSKEEAAEGRKEESGVASSYKCKESSVTYSNESKKFVLEEPFAELLIEHMNKKGLESTDVYKACNMTKANFSNQLDPKHKPSKKSVLALCIGLKLSLEESNHFLSRAGFSFSSCELQDVIVKYFITESIYDIDVVNTALYEHKMSTIP